MIIPVVGLYVAEIDLPSTTIAIDEVSIPLVSVALAEMVGVEVLTVEPSAGVSCVIVGGVVSGGVMVIVVAFIASTNP